MLEHIPFTSKIKVRECEYNCPAVLDDRFLCKKEKLVGRVVYSYKSYLVEQARIARDESLLFGSI